ncbi:MAG: NHLP bacteriocin export ABC transporter permease/ATPase subunit, partial [Longimicrobiales bacterium]|nr:NHLP bacteriocin export ABC transporter permease/ATPase subunit [Longimicrobiales bacterium]
GAAAATAPALRAHPDTVWRGAGGHPNVFAADTDPGEPEGPRHHLFTVEAGGILPGLEPAWADEVGLLAAGTPSSVVLKLPVAELEVLDGSLEAEMKELMGDYVEAFSSAVSERSRPQVDVLMAPGEETELEAGARVSARRGVVWVRIRDGTLRFADRETLPIEATEIPFPLANGSWATAGDTARVQTDDPHEIGSGTLWRGLRAFQKTALEWADEVLEEDRGQERARLRARLEGDEEARRAALHSLTRVIHADSAEAVDPRASAILNACRLVGEALGIEFEAPPTWDKRGAKLSHEVQAIARASGVGYRRVALPDGWWNRDNGPLLGFLRDIPAEASQKEWEAAELEPVALLPSGRSRYDLVDGATGRRERLDEEAGSAIEPFGYQFYRSLPARGLEAKDLWRFATFGIWRDLRTIFLMGVLGAALGLLLPILTGTVFDSIIPAAQVGQLGNVFVALLVAALSTAAFKLTRSFAVIRFHTRAESGLQMAVLDRLVRLPLPFFRSYTAGDLGLRARGISVIGHALGGATIDSILSSVVSAGALLLLFWYSPPLALLACAILVVNVLVLAVSGYVALGYARRMEAVEGRLSGLVLELLTGIPKLRVAATEARAFARWSDTFREQQQLGYAVGRFRNHVTAFNGVLSVLSTLALYWAYVSFGGAQEDLSTGQFLAFYAAFGMFIGAGTELTGTAIRLIELVPTWERAKPILDAVPEVDEEKPDPGELTGHIEATHLTFRYTPDGPVVLDDVSVEAAPGEFIALVGPSGAGKSTLLRILLGFDLPDSSSVYYDGHDLTTIDVRAVRRQIGVVLQSSRLTAGDIYSNIVGTSGHSHEEAWEAVRMAGIEEEIRAMPMGLHTVVPEGGGTLSGGQQQRLLIARALVRRPRILFFDEATSALDNRAQQRVAESIDTLHATRVVIAHRLSTIRNADRIYVLDRGRVVQSGTFDDLMSEPGLFADLAARQEA